MGMGFFHHLSVPEMWESQVFGFFYSLPIPEFAISQTGIKTGIGLLTPGLQFFQLPLHLKTIILRR